MDAGREVRNSGPGVSSITAGGRADTWARPSGHVLLTEDGVRIEAAHHPAAPGGRCPGHAGATGNARAGGPADRPAIVIAHGFTGALDRPAVLRAAQRFAQFGGVITFSFRGHGNSGGRSTVGDREVLDLDAAVRWARLLGYRQVATVGFSMGGSVVIRQAAAAAECSAPVAAVPALDRPAPGADPARRPESRHGRRIEARPDAVVAVSAPARWYYRGTAPMRRVHWAVTRPLGRAVSRYGLGTRIHPYDWDPVPLSPVESVPLIAPTPLLIVHGDRDPYFPLDHPQSLAAAAGGAADLWIEPGFGHAENAASGELLQRIAGWITDRLPPCGFGQQP